MAKTISLRSDIGDVTKIGRGGESGDGEKSKRRRRRNGGGEEFPRGKESAEVEATTGDDDRRPNVSLSFEEYINGIEWEKNIEDQVFSDAQMVAKMFTDILKEESGNGEDDDGLVFGEGKLVEEFWNETGSQSTTATSSLSSSECVTNDEAEKAPDVTVCGSPSAPNLRLVSSGGEDEVSGLTCTCNASGCHVAGGFRVRRLQDSVSLTPDAALSSSSSTTSLATTGSSVYGTLSDVSLAEALDQAKRRMKVFSPVKVLSAHNFGSRAQEATSVHPRAAKQRSAYEGCSSSSSTLSFTTGSLCRVRSTDSLEGWKRERGRSRSSSYPSQQPALSWSSPNIQFSSQLHAKGHRRGGKGGKGAGRGGLPVLLAWHLILLVTLLRGNTSSIIPVLEKLIC